LKFQSSQFEENVIVSFPNDFDVSLYAAIYKQGRTSVLRRIPVLMHNKRQGAILDDASSVN